MPDVVSLPIDLPRIVPDDWAVWWDVWNNNAVQLIKNQRSPNSESAIHVGFDVFRSPLFFPVYSAPLIDLRPYLPRMMETLLTLPVKCHGIRFVQSRSDFPLHVDHRFPVWQLRYMFSCDDPAPQWFYSNMDGTDSQPLQLPESTNWWAYHDGFCKHGTNYVEKYPKIIIQVFADQAQTANLVEQNIGKFPQYEISYNV